MLSILEDKKVDKFGQKCCIIKKKWYNLIVR